MKYIYFELLNLLDKQVIYDLRLNMRLGKNMVATQGPKNLIDAELDMAFSDGKNLYVVECKSGELKNKGVRYVSFDKKYILCGRDIDVVIAESIYKAILNQADIEFAELKAKKEKGTRLVRDTFLKGVACRRDLEDIVTNALAYKSMLKGEAVSNGGGALVSVENRYNDADKMAHALALKVWGVDFNTSYKKATSSSVSLRHGVNANIKVTAQVTGNARIGK